MRSYCYYVGNCHSLGLDSIKLTLQDGTEFEIMKTQYLLQKYNPFRCEIMIQAYPDVYLQEMNEIDLIIGQPFLYNHYTIFNMFDGTIGIYKAYYT